MSKSTKETQIITEKWIRNRLLIDSTTDISHLSRLSLPGINNQKFSHLGVSLKNFINLRNINLDRNSINSLDGLQFCKNLEKLTVYLLFILFFMSYYLYYNLILNMYYNNISSLEEILRLKLNKFLKELDLRLNPVTKLHHNSYRLFTIFHLPHVSKLDEREVRESERRAAREMFENEEPISPPPSLVEQLASPAKPPLFAKDHSMFQPMEDPYHQPTESYIFNNPTIEEDTDDLLIQHLQSNDQLQNSPKIQNNNNFKNENENYKIPAQLPKNSSPSTFHILTPSSPPTQNFENNNNNNNNNLKTPSNTHIYDSPKNQQNSYGFINNSLSLSPPSNPYLEINKNLQQEIENLKAKIGKYKQKSKEWKSVDAENQHLRYQLDMLSQENVNLRNGWKETEKQINNHNLNEQKTNELISMLKESHRTILKENEYLHAEIEKWKIKEETNSKLWQQNYEKLKQHIYLIDDKRNPV